jgi:hypothetical protein
MVADYAVDSFHYSGNSVAARLGTEPSRNFNSSPACVGADDCGRRCRNQPENRLNRGGILGVGARLTPAPMLRLMPHQSPFRLFHLVFEASRLFFVPIRSVKSIERIDKPAVPKHGDAIFRVQVFTIRAGHHERRILENREMGKRDVATQRFITLLAFSPGVTGRHPMISLITQHALLRQD